MKRDVPKAKRNSCPTGKTRFKDDTHAKTALRNVMVASADYGKPTRCYHCPVCKGWHLSSREG